MKMKIGVMCLFACLMGSSLAMADADDKKWVIHIERLQKEKANGNSVNIGFNPSKVGSPSRGGVEDGKRDRHGFGVAGGVNAASC